MNWLTSVHNGIRLCGRRKHRERPGQPANRGSSLADHAPSTLATYWTQIGELDRSRAESAWRWFIERYRGFVHDVLGRFVGSEHADDATSDFWSVPVRQRRAAACRSFAAAARLPGRCDAQLRAPVAARPWDCRSRKQTTRESSTNWLAAQRCRSARRRGDVALGQQCAAQRARRRWSGGGRTARSCSAASTASAIATGEPGRPLSITETAARLQCNVNAVHQALHRGARPRHCLEIELRNLVGAEKWPMRSHSSSMRLVARVRG